MGLTPGTDLGPFEIVAPIGAGGMGEVYRARDTKLDRDVAIKVLPESFALDADRVARFEREAKTLAALNHPNIAAIYGLESNALVMELVDGEDLSAHIARGPIVLADALPIARQIADALEAAHEQGIIHRDLKPANVKVRADGTVKVLDFGLAKAMDPPSPSATAGKPAEPWPTITTPAVTQMGMIIGTAAYMAPEQAKGKAVDKRADIWAFGVVLYEMLTGERPFKGDDVSETLAAVLKDTPSMAALLPETPPRLARLIARCLDRDLKTRLRDIGEARIEIARIEAGAPDGIVTTVAAAPVAQARWPRVVPWALAGASAVLALWMAIRPQPAADLPVARVWLGVDPAERLLSGYSGDVSAGQGRPSRTAMTFSPDGRALAFTAEREGRVQLYIRRLDQLDATPIAGTEGASTPFFAPDGQSLGFYASGALRRVPVGGGPVVELCKTELVFGASWSSKGQIVFANLRGGLWQVAADGGTPAAVTKLQSDTGEISHRLPQVLPDGETVMFTVTSAGFPSWDETLVVAQSLTTGTRKVLVEGAADARLVSTGHLVYLRRGMLLAVPFDLRRLVVTGPAVGVASNVMQAANIQPLQIDTGAGQFAVSTTGSLVYATGGAFPQDRWSIVWVDRTGRAEALRVPAGMWHAPRLSPDGRRIAFGSNMMGDRDVWTYDVQRAAAVRVPIDGSQDIPVWTPDGARLALSTFSERGTYGSLAVIDPDGRSPLQRLTPPSVAGFPGSWTADGSELAFTAASVSSQAGTVSRSIWVVSRDGKTEPRQLFPDSTEPDLSADGRWLAYVTGSPNQIYVQPYPTLDHRVLVSIDGGAEPVWRRDGRELYYLQNVSAGGALKVQVMAVPVTTTPTFSAGRPHVLFEGAFRVDLTSLSVS